MFSLPDAANLAAFLAGPSDMTEQKKATFDGACTCRDVRYRMQSRPLFVHCCHCRWCQRETGSAFVLNAFLETDRLTLLSGDVEKVAVPTESGNGQTIVRCSKCLIAVWSHYGADHRISMVRVGTLNDPDCMPPDIHIFTESKQPWVILNDDLPVLPKYYQRSKYWPAESLARRESLLQKAG
jgi:hypothetical protein